MGRKREKKSGRMTEVIKYAAIYYSTCIDEFSLFSSLSGILLNFSNSLLLFSLSFLRKRERLITEELITHSLLSFITQMFHSFLFCLQIVYLLHRSVGGIFSFCLGSFYILLFPFTPIVRQTEIIFDIYKIMLAFQKHPPHTNRVFMKIYSSSGI